jgi:hypothetical protein
VQGLQKYLTEKYIGLGKKGMLIESAMKSMGTPNLSQVTPDRYDELFTLVEAI